MNKFAASTLAVGLGLAAACSSPTLDQPATSMTDVSASLTSTVVVSPSNMNGWFFYDDNLDVINNALGTFVTGPGTPPHGIGSAQVSTSGSQRPNLATYQFSGTPLASITSLKFTTYNPSAGNGGSSSRSAYLHFNVDFNGSDVFQRRLVYVPSQNGVVVPNTWKEWDAISGGTALWNYSGATWPGDGLPGTTLKTWSAILTQYPGIRIRVTDAFVGLRVGEPYASGYTENMDSFTFGTGGNSTVFDFEPYEQPANKDSCKGDGWKNLRRANGTVFKNQGDCVSYTNNGK